MDDLISRKAAIETLLDEGLITAAVYIERMPSAEKKGEWVILSDGWAECSSCGEVGCIVGHLWKYCPYCGARMEE